jgi:hypothetical protein
MHAPRSLTKITPFFMVRASKKRKHIADFNDRNFYASTVQKTYQISHSDPLHDQSSFKSLRNESKVVKGDKLEIFPNPLVSARGMNLTKVRAIAIAPRDTREVKFVVSDNEDWMSAIFAWKSTCTNLRWCMGVGIQVIGMLLKEGSFFRICFQGFDRPLLSLLSLLCLTYENG